MPVLDTDVLTIVQRRSEPEYGRLARRLSALPPGTVVATTIVSFEEQLRGWLEYVKRARPAQLAVAYAKLAELHRDFSARPVLPFDTAALTAFEQLLKARTRTGTMDLKIAAITISRDDILLTKNLAHFRQVPGLRAEDWTV